MMSVRCHTPKVRTALPMTLLLFGKTPSSTKLPAAAVKQLKKQWHPMAMVPVWQWMSAGPLPMAAASMATILWRNSAAERPILSIPKRAIRMLAGILIMYSKTGPVLPGSMI